MIIKQRIPKIIAGPCAFESREQLKEIVKELKKLGISCIRAPLWKPRTMPGWEGVGAHFLHFLLEETIPYGLIPATEVMTADQAMLIVEALRKYGKNAPILLWLGSRNQNHIEQRRIAQILSSGSKGIWLMFKNQMWEDEKHWLGIFEHLKASGFPKNRMLSCHRGFSPGKSPNPGKFRNIPDFNMAMRVKKRVKLPMFLDPSHIGGSRENVLKIIEDSKNHNFDGLMIEVHLDPKNAKTDQNQQLNMKLFKKLIKQKQAA